MEVKPLHPRLRKYLKLRDLEARFNKQFSLFMANPRHPSLHTERLEPKRLRIYSFRLDKQYRVIFVVHNQAIEVVDINDHYRP